MSSTRRTTPLLAALGLAAAMAATGCSTGNGHLVIAGGAVSTENKAIYRAIAGDMPHVGGRIGILPTASGEPELAVQDQVEGFTNAGTPARQLVAINVTTKNPQDADNPAIVKLIRSSDAVFFTGGDQARVLDAFVPGGVETEGARALRGVLARDGVLAGTSAGAALMSSPMIGGGRSETALLKGAIDHVDAPEGEEPGVIVRQGMGYFPYGITDQHFLARGRYGRLAVALESTGIRRGYGVQENCAINVDLTTHRIAPIGNHALTVIDTGHLETDGASRRNLRVSVLSTGDFINGQSGRITHDAGRIPLVPRDGGATTLAPLPDAWAEDALIVALRQLADNPATTITLRSPAFDVTLSEDQHTRFVIGRGAGGELALGAVNVRLDILKAR